MTKSTVKKTPAKTEAKGSVAKAEASKAELKEAVKAEPVKAEPEKKEETVEKAAPAKKTAVRAKKSEEAPAAPKKATARKTAAKAKEVKAALSIQFAGKDYTAEKLVEIAKDVWKYDLGRKEEEFQTVELYVKPEESAVYYMINGETTGNFAI